MTDRTSRRRSAAATAGLRPFPKGHSGNPDGRPRGFAGLAKRIARESNDGQELVRFAFSVLRGEPFAVTRVVPVANAGPEQAPVVTTWNETPKLELRMEALAWLADRFAGRPLQVIPDAGEGKQVWLVGIMGQLRDPLAEASASEVALKSLPTGEA